VDTVKVFYPRQQSHCENFLIRVDSTKVVYRWLQRRENFIPILDMSFTNSMILIETNDLSTADSRHLIRGYTND